MAPSVATPRADGWLWQKRLTTQPHGDRRLAQPSGRRWSSSRTSAFGHRRLHLRVCGRAVSLSVRHSSGEAHLTIGLPVLRQVRLSTPLLSAGSLSALSMSRGGPRTRRGGSGCRGARRSRRREWPSWRRRGQRGWRRGKGRRRRGGRGSCPRLPPLVFGLLDLVLRGPCTWLSFVLCCLRSSLGFTVDACSYDSLLAFGRFPVFLRDGGLWILRSFLCRPRSTGDWTQWEMTSGAFRILFNCVVRQRIRMLRQSRRFGRMSHIFSLKVDYVILRAPCIRQSPVRFLVRLRSTCLDFLGVASEKCFVFHTLGSSLDTALASVTEDFSARAPFVVVRPMMLVIMSSMNLKDSFATRRPRSLPTSAAACAWQVFRVTIFHAVFPSAVDLLIGARHPGRYGPEGQYVARRLFRLRMCRAGFAGDDAQHSCPCSMFCFIPLVLRQARDAPHHGSCSFKDVATLVVDNVSTCSRLFCWYFCILRFPPLVGRPAMPGIMVGPVEVFDGPDSADNAVGSTVAVLDKVRSRRCRNRGVLHVPFWTRLAGPSFRNDGHVELSPPDLEVHSRLLGDVWTDFARSLTPRCSASLISCVSV